jgi:hypothetical protein
MAGFPIPPWLQARPAEFATAHEAGLRSGIAAAQIWANANAERARLEQAAKRQDMEAQLERERLQEKSIYEAQKLAADVAYNKASLDQAQSRVEQTQANAERMARQWEAQNQLAQKREGRLGSDAASRLAIAQQQATETGRHNLVMENRGPSQTRPRLSPEAQVDDDLLKQKIGQANAQIKAAHDLYSSNPSQKNKKREDDLAAARDDLVMQRKKLHGFTGFNPVMGKRQMADESSMERYSISPLTDQTDESDQEE